MKRRLLLLLVLLPFSFAQLPTDSSLANASSSNGTLSVAAPSTIPGLVGNSTGSSSVATATSTARLSQPHVIFQTNGTDRDVQLDPSTIIRNAATDILGGILSLSGFLLGVIGCLTKW